MSQLTALQLQAQNRPIVFHYHDYREFLRDWVGFLRQSGLKISYRKISLKSGLTTCYLSHVLGKKISMSAAALDKLLPQLFLEDSEASFLKLLRLVGESLLPEERLEAFKKIRKVLSARGLQPSELSGYRYLTKWYFLAIREMVGMDGFRLEAKWIQKRLKHHVSLKEIRKAIKFLTEAGLIDVSDPKNPKIAEKPMSFEDGFSHLALHEFYDQMSTLAREARYTIPREERKIVSHNIAIPSSKLEEVKKCVDEVFEKLNELTSSYEGSDSVYHISLATFPLAKEPKKGGSS